MDYCRLRNSELIVSRLGFGCCPMGGHGWGKVSSDEGIKAVRVALDNGVNFFDTADVYGLGESEKRLGKALKGRRNEAVIATKFGVRIDKHKKIYYDNSAAWINCALDESLRRLDIDCIDLYQIHYKDDKTSLDDVVEILEQKRLEGKIRYYGLSNISSADVLQNSFPEGMISFQMEYSLANRSREDDIVRIVRENGLSFLSWGSLGQGVLTGKYNTSTKFPTNDRRSRSVYVNFHGEKLKRNMVIAENIKRISSSMSKTLPQIAIRWIIDYLGFGVVLVGVKNPEQIKDSIGAFGWELLQHEIDVLEMISK